MASDQLRAARIAVAGFIDEARALGHEFVPLLWCSARPSAHVTHDAYETILQRLLELLSEARSLDSVYLDLQGAMAEARQADESAVRNVVCPFASAGFRIRKVLSMVRVRYRAPQAR